MLKFHIGVEIRYTSAVRKCWIRRSICRHDCRWVLSIDWPIMRVYLTSMFVPATAGRSWLYRSTTSTVTSRCVTRKQSRKAVETRRVFDSCSRGVAMMCSTLMTLPLTGCLAAHANCDACPPQFCYSVGLAAHQRLLSSSEECRELR